MSAEAIYLRDRHNNKVQIAVDTNPCKVFQLNDGRAAVFNSAEAAAANDTVNYKSDGQYTVAKTTGEVWLDGQRLFWDRSAGKATYKPASDRDFFLGSAVGDAASADASGVVNLNVEPKYIIDLAGSGFQSVLVGTPAAGGFGYPVDLGGALILELTATNEAQKVDALSVDGFAPSANWIAEGCFRVLNGGAGAAPDASIGIASGTHASDFESVAELAAIHLDGNSVNINVESDDGTTDVNPTDTTVDFTAGSALANRVYFQIDGRDPASVKFYVNGARVNSGTTFDVSQAAGPLFAIAHLEKTAAVDVFKLAIDSLRVRIAEQD